MKGILSPMDYSALLKFENNILAFKTDLKRSWVLIRNTDTNTDPKLLFICMF